MSEGRHAAAGKSAGWTLLVAAEIIGSLALVGLAIYWLTVATTLALFGVNSLLLVALFIKSVVQRREDRWFPWLAAGALATTTVVFASPLVS